MAGTKGAALSVVLEIAVIALASPAQAHKASRLSARMTKAGDVKVTNNSNKKVRIRVTVRWNDWDCIDRGTCGSSMSFGDLTQTRRVPGDSTRTFAFSYPAIADEARILHVHRL
jgi:hypothetical protein